MPTRIKGRGLWLTTESGIEVCRCGHLFTAHEDPGDDDTTAGACEVVNGIGGCRCMVFAPVALEAKPAGPEEV